MRSLLVLLGTVERRTSNGRTSNGRTSNGRTSNGRTSRPAMFKCAGPGHYVSPFECSYKKCGSANGQSAIDAPPTHYVLPFECLNKKCISAPRTPSKGL